MHFIVSVVKVFKDSLGDSELRSFIRCQIPSGAVVIWMFKKGHQVPLSKWFTLCLTSWCWLLEKEMPVPPHRDLSSVYVRVLMSSHWLLPKEKTQEGRQMLQGPKVASDGTCYPLCHIPFTGHTNQPFFILEGCEYQPSDSMCHIGS